MTAQLGVKLICIFKFRLLCTEDELKLASDEWGESDVLFGGHAFLQFGHASQSEFIDLFGVTVKGPFKRVHDSKQLSEGLRQVEAAQET